MQQLEESWAQIRQHPDWRDYYPGASGCSQELEDLLDRIFMAEEHARISMSEMLAHPWLQRQLPPKYEGALQQIEEQQMSKHRKHHRKGTASPPTHSPLGGSSNNLSVLQSSTNSAVSMTSSEIEEYCEEDEENLKPWETEQGAG